jgi:hypothetical protein
MADPLLARSAIDRLQSAAHELVLDGGPYRQRQRSGSTDPLDQPPAGPIHTDARVVPSSWRATLSCVGRHDHCGVKRPGIGDCSFP